MKKKPNHTLISSLFITVLCVAALALVATLPGGGWWFGAQIQNASNTNTAAVTFTVYDFATNVSPQTRVDNIGPGASKTYLNTDFSLPNNFQGSSKTSSNQNIRAIVNLTNRWASINGNFFGDSYSPSPAAGQYQGMEAGATTLRFPLVKIDYDQKSTTFIVQNAGTGSATATASFTFGSTTYNYLTPTINPGKMATIEPIYARNGSNHPPTNSVGSLTVTSSQPLTGIALEHLTGELHATVLQATRGFLNGEGDTTLYAPINKYKYYGRFTGLQVQNVSQNPVDINVNYVEIPEPPHSGNPTGCPGGAPFQQAQGVPAGTSHTFSSNVLHEGCFASATITATGGNVVAIVNEEFTSDYLNAHPGQAREDTSYAALRFGSATANLSAPLFKEDSYGNGTGLSVQNIDNNSPASVKATFKNSNNQTFVTNYMDIPPKQAIVLFDMRLLNQNPPAWWHGWNGTAMTPTALGCQNNSAGCGTNGVFSVILNSIYGQNIVAIANEVAYPISAPFFHMDESNYEAFNLP